jgi:hypothetical protein
MKTFFSWIDKEAGHFSVINLTFVLDQQLPDGTRVEAEFMFRALDKPDDVKKLLSLELTGAWGNEARELPKPVIDMLQGRVGRYPPKMSGVSPTWFGVILDTNPPDEDHWFYKMFEEDMPETFQLFKQPSGLSPEAENIENLPPNYYKNMMAGKDSNWIDVYVHGKYGFIADGEPVYPEFNRDIHVVPAEELHFDPKEDLWIGLDFGRTPAAAFAQLQGDRWVFLDEITTTNMGAKDFAKLLGSHIKRYYRTEAQTFIFGDPSGDYAGQASDDTPFLVLQSAGIEAYPAPSQDPTIRREALASQMTVLSRTGKPRLAISTKCRMLVKGLAGGYKYRRIQVPGEERYQSKPDKNKFSHVCEAAEYLLVGAGEDPTIIEGREVIELDYSERLKAIA